MTIIESKNKRRTAFSQNQRGRLSLNIKQAKLLGMLAAHKLSKDNFKYILKTVEQTIPVRKMSMIIDPKLARARSSLKVTESIDTLHPKISLEEANDIEVSTEFRKVVDEYQEIRRQDRVQVKLFVSYIG